MIFEFGSCYNFLTISNSILSPEYRNMTVEGIMSLNQAVRLAGVNTDVLTIREQLIKETGLSLLPANKAKYILFLNQNDENVLLAEDWIKLDSVKLVTALKAIFTIDNITNDDVNIINNTIRSMGYKNITLTVETS